MEESQGEGVNESLDVYVDDTQDDLDADIKDGDKSVSSCTEGVQSSRGEGKSPLSSTGRQREAEGKTTATRLRSSIVSVQKLRSSHGKRVAINSAKPGGHREQRASPRGKKSTVQKSENKSSSNDTVLQKSTAQISSTSSNTEQKTRNTGPSSSSNKTEQKMGSTMQKTRSGGQKTSGESGQKSSGGSAQKSSGSTRHKATSGDGQKSSGGSSQRSSSAIKQKPSSEGCERKRSIGNIPGIEEKLDSKVKRFGLYGHC